ncbi:hypothetical protein EIP86_007340 [Pleurotus ostreatoroseus]|nr:hypothetical protein EIP86_007340 [Pleurotus ostreatoroseus]
MALDPKRAVPTLKGYITRKDPARFTYVAIISRQISKDLFTGGSLVMSAAEIVETPRIAQWVENDLHLVVMQIILDKKNYSGSLTEIGRKMRRYVTVSMGILSNCCDVLYARKFKRKTLYEEQPTEHAKERDSAILLHLDSILAQFKALWPLVRSECYDMGSTPLPVLLPDYSDVVRHLPGSDRPPSLVDNGSFVDILLANMVLDEASSTVINESYEALMMTLACVEDVKPIVQYLRNSSISLEHAIRIATIFIVRIRLDFTSKESLIDAPPSPFVFLQALDEVYPIVVCSKVSGMSLITCVVHAWKHALCMGGLTDVTYECIKLLTYVCLASEPQV